MNKYKCVKKGQINLNNTRNFMKRNSVDAIGEESNTMYYYSKDYIYHNFLLEIFIKRLINKGKLFKVRKKIFKGLKNFKKVSRKNPLFFYIFLLNYYIIFIDFKIKVKSGRSLVVPANLGNSDEERFLETMKLFKKTLKLNKQKNINSTLFFELFTLNFITKKSIFFNQVLENYYEKILDNFQNIGMR